VKILCPSCGSLIASGQLNVESDVAVCPSCSEVFQLSALIAAGQETDQVDLFDPPRGAWFLNDITGWTVGATTRSPVALFLVPFMCVWSGFSLGGIYGSQIAAGKFNLVMSIFGIPFILGSLLFGSLAVMTVWGKVVVTVDRNLGRVFTGVGRIGWTQNFDWTAITRIEEDGLGYHHSGSSGVVIVLVGKTQIKLGSMLTDVRRFFMLQALRKQLAIRSKPKI
jgi:hypothetical protein